MAHKKGQGTSKNGRDSAAQRLPRQAEGENHVAEEAEGRAVGLAKGYEIGAELGYYRGACVAWAKLLETEAASEDGGAPCRALL